MPVSNSMSESEFLEKHAVLVYSLALRLAGNRARQSLREKLLKQVAP